MNPIYAETIESGLEYEYFKLYKCNVENTGGGKASSTDISLDIIESVPK